MPVSPNCPGLQDVIIISRPLVSWLMLPVVTAINHAHAFLPSEAGEAAVGGAPGLTEADHDTQEGQHGEPHHEGTVG